MIDKVRSTPELEGIDSEGALSRFLLLEWFFLLSEERDKAVFYFGFIPVETCWYLYAVSGRKAIFVELAGENEVTWPEIPYSFC